MEINESISSLKKSIIAIGLLLWEKGLVSGLNGNISLRVSGDTILLTGRATCLGLLQEKDIIHMRLDGQVLEEGIASSEKLMHTEIYKQFPEAEAVIHTHTTFTNAYFLENTVLAPRIFESKLYLGDITAVEQYSPTVTDIGPVVAAFQNNNIVVLRHHGVVAKGKDLFSCFLLIQALEDAVTVEAVSRVYRVSATSINSGPVADLEAGPREAKRCRLFSKDQIESIVKIVNGDAQMADLGAQTNMTMSLAVKLEETGQTYCFSFKEGKIVHVSETAEAEFLITAPAMIWRSVFNGALDPFVATTQKKMNLKGDFARISKWYAPCSRIFELWKQVPVD